MRSTARLAPIALVAAAALLAPATAMAAPSDSRTTIVLEQAAPIVQVVESALPGRTGDTVYFEADLSQKGAGVGALSGEIVTTDVTSGNTTDEIRKRTLVFALRGGQIVALGTGRYLLEPAAGVPVLRSVTTTAIVGGTGAYIGARGQVRTVRHTDGTYTHTITLVK